VACRPLLALPTSVTAARGVPLSVPVRARSAIEGQTVVVTATGLPAGLAITGSAADDDWAIAGTPESTVAVGEHDVVVTATDVAGMATVEVTLDVLALTGLPTGARVIVPGPFGTLRGPAAAGGLRIGVGRFVALLPGRASLGGLTGPAVGGALTLGVVVTPTDRPLLAAPASVGGLAGPGAVSVSLKAVTLVTPPS